MKIFDKLKTLYERVFVPPQGTHELLKNPVTIPEAEQSSSVHPHPSTPSVKPWVQEIKDNKED